MFTGLIQAQGTLSRLARDQLTVQCRLGGCDRLFQDIALGDSIAVDGVCLTVEQILNQGFVASASPETLARSTLGDLGETTPVNLEASLRVGSKIGGHFVTGHVDGKGYLDAIAESRQAWTLSFTVPDPRVNRYIVPKGSVAVNGISLTVADCSTTGDWFSVAVIPVTYAETNLQHLQPGQAVNLEGDILGKYVEKLLRVPPTAALPITEDLSLSFLAEHGYL